MKGIIYYTENRIREPIFSTVQKYILESSLPIVSVSLKPTDFGKNIVVEGQRSYPTMVKQIVTALENSTTEYVFFCEDDVLYPKSHFDFNPTRDDIFYYNKNVWRWYFNSNEAIRYERMLPLSCICANRNLILDHYKMRERKIKEWGLDKMRSREPRWARLWGYEPGTKKKKRGGLTNDDFETWSSEEPVIDIRHPKTFSRPKIKLEEFKHQPKNWEKININKIPGWNFHYLSQVVMKSF